MSDRDELYSQVQLLSAQTKEQKERIVKLESAIRELGAHISSDAWRLVKAELGDFDE